MRRSPVLIRPVASGDRAALWAILAPVIRAGETYTLARDLTEEQALAYWLGPDKESFVAEAGDEVLGTYYLRANQAGGGRHICNCGFMTGTKARGRGVARAMGLHALSHARARGFRGMQFNFVVSTNAPAIGLWHALGFETVGRLPLAFEHPAQGFVDALVMFRPL